MRIGVVGGDVVGVGAFGGYNCVDGYFIAQKSFSSRSYPIGVFVMNAIEFRGSLLEFAISNFVSVVNFFEIF